MGDEVFQTMEVAAPHLHVTVYVTLMTIQPQGQWTYSAPGESDVSDEDFLWDFRTSPSGNSYVSMQTYEGEEEAGSDGGNAWGDSVEET